MTHVLGLTGSIGMGKTTVANLFKTNGIPVQDADAVVHELLAQNGAGVALVAQAFPDTLIKGAIHRPTLGKMVFGNPEKLAQLETILHPLVAQQRDIFLAQNQTAPLVVLDIPLLLEKDIVCDSVCVCMADPKIRNERVLNRPNMTPEKLANIIKTQMPDDEKIDKANYIIRTDCPITETEKQVENLIHALTTKNDI